MAKETFSFEEAAAPAAPAPAAATKPVTFSFEEAAAPAAKTTSAKTFSFEEAAGSSPSKGASNNGMLEAGNIDLTNRPRVKNSDGSISTVRSMGVNIGGKEVLIPTVSEDGRIMTDDEAVQAYRRTGRHLGMFSTPEAATRYAEQLHNDQAKLIQTPTEQPAGVTDPSGADFGQQIMAVANPRRESVLEGVQMPEPKFDPAEAQRLSRRDYAESHPVPGTEGRSGAVMRPDGENKPADPMFERGAAIRAASMPVRAAFKAVSGIAKGAGGVLRSAGDLTGIPQLTAAGQATSAGADQFEQGMSDAGPVAGFGPKSPVPYLGNMAEGAASSLGQSTMMATSFGPRAVIPLLSVMTAGQEYERARNAGLDPAMALAGAIPKGTFEAIGEKFTGLDKVAGAMGTLLTRGASEQAKHTAADVLVRAGIREVPGEIITYLGQTATDLLPGIGLNPDLTMGQFLDGLRDTTVQAAMMGATFGSGGAVAKVDPRIKRLRDAGENEAADLLQKRQDQLNLQASVISELSGMQSDQTRSPEFQAGYIGLRADGTKPVEAAGRSALNAGFRQTATAAGMSEKAIAAALEASRKISLDKLPGFLQRYTQGLANRGAIQAPDAALGTLLEAARDDAMDSATQSLYGDTRQTIEAAQALESGQNQTPAVDNTAPQAMNSVAPSESVQAVDNIERILGQQTTRPDIDQAAHAAATSPLNDLPEPTQAQKEAGNYQKGHINLHGLDIAIENPQGSERRGVSPDGKEWSSTLASHYGYFKRTNGNDGDHVDTFIGPNPDSTKVFVVDQLNKDGSFDEHKVMLGFDSLEEADRGYHANYEPGWTGRGAITEVPLPAFKSWVRDGKKKEPISAIQFKTQEGGQGQGAAGTVTPEAPDAAAIAGNGVERDTAGAVQPAAAADLQPSADQHPAVELSGKTPAQLAAMERAAKRLRLPHTGSGPLSAHAFIAAEGGLSRSAMADTGFDANVRVGNRWLFAAQGKGLTLEQAAMKLAQAGYLATENESDAADLIRRSMTQPQYTAEGWQALAEAEHAARYEDHLAAQQEADTGADPLAPEGFTDAELEQSGYDDASPEVQAEVRALLATAEDQGIDAETVLENVAKTTENATQQAYYETAKRALETAIAAQPGSAGDQRPPAGSESPAPGQEQDPGQVSREPQQTPADAGVSVSGFTMEPRADGTLAVKGDAKAIREALSAIPAKLLVTMKGGILVGRTQAEKAQAILRGEKPKLTAREAAEAGERARQAEKKARQQAARAEFMAAPAGLSIGIMPSTAEAVTVRNGIVFIGDNEAIGYDSGEPVTVAAGASDQQIVDALKEAGALSRRQRVFGLAKTDSEGLTAPTREDVIAQQERADTAAELDQREQVRRESEAGSGQFSLTQEDGRQDTTGSLFDQPRKTNEQSAMARGAPVWRSALRDGVATIPAKTQGADGWRAQIQGLVNKGAVKVDEVEWSGVTDWLQMQTGKVTKEQVLDYLDGNGVQVEEVTLGGKDGERIYVDPDTGEEFPTTEKATKYESYTLPGGENYREVLLTLPVTDNRTAKSATSDGDVWRVELSDGTVREFSVSNADDKSEAERYAKDLDKATYKSNHWDQLNVLAHIRLNDRTGADGKRVLFVEEIQSDWGQEGKKKGFAPGAKEKAEIDAITREVDAAGGFDKAPKELQDRARAAGARLVESGIPQAPFVGKTDAWLNLALKRIITMAAQDGYDRVAFVNGTQSAERYDLSKQISKIRYADNNSGGAGWAEMSGKPSRGTLTAWNLNGKEVISKFISDPAKELPGLIGKDAAEKLLTSKASNERTDGGTYARTKELSGLDLKVGGEGMKAFYDQIVPSAVKKLLPKVGGGQMEAVTIDQTGEAADNWRKNWPDQPLKTLEQPGFTITPAMREKAAQGLPMFARGGQDQTDTPEFKRWFGDSKVVDAQGKPLVVYRGEHGGDGQPRTTLASYTFVDDPKVASTYAMSPNDTRNFLSADSPKVIPAFLSIQNPVIENRDDPFVEFSDLVKKLGRDVSIKFARKHADWIQNTGNWEENFADKYESVDALLDASPSAVSELYMDAYPLLDDFAFVGAAKDAGFDGAIHVGNGESMDAVEYKVFLPEQIKSATGNNGQFDASNADITLARGMDADAFRRAFSPPQAMSVAGAQKIIDELTATWENGPKFKAVASAKELPIVAPRDTRGWVSEKGTAYIVASNHVSRDAIAQTLAHEAIGHYGLWKILGKDGKAKFERNLQLALKTGNKPLTKIRDKVRRLYVDDTGKFNLSPAEEANEIAAFAVEEAVDPVTGEFTTGMSWLKQFWAQIADFLRGLGLPVKFTKAELHGLLVASMKGLQAGHRLDGGAEVLVAAARADKPVELPDVIVGNPLGAATGLPDYAAAKAGDVAAAVKVARALVGDKLVEQVRAAIGDTKPVIVPVVAEEAAGRNKIPLAAAEVLAARLGLDTETAVVQANRPHRTGMDGLDRLFSVPDFTGEIEAGRDYLLVDDTLTQGATFAALASHIQQAGGRVVGAVALTGKQYSATIQPSDKSLQQLREKHGDLETDFRAATGYGFDALTQSEARYLANYEPAQRLRDRIAEEGRRASQSRNSQAAGGLNGALARGTAATGGAIQSPPKSSQWRDTTGRAVFAPGQALYNLIGKAANPLLVKLQLKAASPELRRQLRQMKLDVQKAQDVAVAVAKESQKLTSAERLMVSDIIEKELAAGTVPPEHAVRLAAAMNTAMGEQSKELIRLGMLTPETAAQWDGRYLPRFYESKLRKQVGEAWADAARLIGLRPKSLKGIGGKHLKGRGLYETIPENQLANYEAMGWQVRDPDYTPSLPSVDGTVQVWRDFTRQERDAMGEIRDAGFRFVMGYMQTQRDIALGRMFEGMATNPETSSRLPRDGWVRVPDTTVEGTGAKRYGKLAGRYVPMETLSQLTNIEEAQSAAWRMYRSAMAVWKEGKTALNPVSHVNNVLSNLTMAHFAGIGYHRFDKYLGAMQDFVKAAPMVKEARDAGLFLGTMSDAELMNTLPPELKELAVKADSKTKKGAEAVYNAMTFWLRKPMGAAYQAEDTFFRYLIYRDARQRGTDPQDAVDYAQKYIFTYDDLPKGARMVRDFGIPFFAYTYKAVPALLNTALTRPDRFLAPAAVLWAANAAAYAIAAGDDDDSWMERLTKYLTDPEFRSKTREAEKLEREFLPPWMKGTTALMTPKAIRLGMDELTKLPVFIDTSRIIPGGDLFDVSPNAMGLPIPQPVTPSHPLFTTAVAMIGNKDLFFGKEIIDSNDTRAEAAEKRAAWIWKQVSPAIAVNNYHWERGMNALAQATGGELKWVPDFLGGDSTGIGKDGNPVQAKYAAMQTFGIKARPIDLETSEQIDNNMRNKMIRDIDAEIRKLQRLNAKGAIADRVLESEWEKALVKKERLREGLTVDGESRN
jgi:hypoxanthine-guanine phosphoribosyltransferase